MAIGITYEVNDGDFHDPRLPIPKEGSFWNFRILASRNCDYKIIYRCFYSNGKFICRSDRPAILAGRSGKSSIEKQYKYIGIALLAPPIYE